MKRFIVRWLVTAACAAAYVNAQALPTAEAILDRFVEVTGGKAAYQQHTTEIMTGTMTIGAQGLSGSLTRYGLAPDKEYSVVELGPIGKIESGVSNGVAWEKSAILGPRLKSGEERERALREAEFASPVGWRKLFPKAETAGVETINGEECYKLLLTPSAGKPETRFYSRKSGLLVKAVATAVTPMGEITAEVDISGYKQFGGVLYPTQSRQKAGGQEMAITITDVRHNEAIPDGYFTVPAEIQALAAKASGK
jgi:hypothetical protein